MKKFFITHLMILFTLISDAQITFQRIYGGNANDGSYYVQQTNDFGYIIVGWTGSFGAGNNDIYLIRTNSFGDTVWTRTFGGINEDIGNCVLQTYDGGFIVAGTTNSFGNGYDACLIKTDSNGNILWARTYGGLGGEGGWRVCVTNDGGFIVLGSTNSFGSGNSDVYLIKTDSIGTVSWTKTYGGSYSDGGKSIVQTSDSGYIVTGYNNNSTFSNANIYVIKTDASGDTLWTKTFGGAGFDVGNSVQQTTDGGYIVTGFVSDFGGSPQKVLLMKLNLNGDLLWTKNYGGLPQDAGLAVRLTNDGGFIISGYTFSFGNGYDDAFLIKSDSAGNILWSKSFGGVDSESANDVQQTADGGFILTGGTDDFGTINGDIYLIKVDSLGNVNCNQLNDSVVADTTIIPILIFNTSISSGDSSSSFSPTIGSGCYLNTLCTTVSVNKVALDKSFIILPNPSSGNFIIVLDGIVIKGKVEIFNVIGENVFKENISNESKKEINLKNISSGIYFVKVFDGEKSYCKKLIVEHD